MNVRRAALVRLRFRQLDSLTGVLNGQAPVEFDTEARAYAAVAQHRTLPFSHLQHIFTGNSRTRQIAEPSAEQ